MEVKINIAAILKDKPQNTRLWSPIFGDVYLKDVTDVNNNTIRITHHGVDNIFLSNGKVWADGDVCLFPSRWMNDWQKFAWKKGDVLVSNDGKQECIFDGWYNKDYTQARVKYWLDISNENNIKCLEENQPLTSVMFKQEDKEKIDCYINTIEEWYGGKKLNRETLEIEKPKPKKKPVFELGNLYVFNEEDEDGELTIIGKLIGKNESEDTLSFGDQYEIENEKFVTDQAFDLRISVHEELREATELEVELFNKHYFIWKKAKEQPAFKTFDKVLVRNEERCKWQPAFFFRDRGEEAAYRYEVLSIQSGRVADFPLCIQYEGNEHLAFTSDPLQRAYGE